MRVYFFHKLQQNHWLMRTQNELRLNVSKLLSTRIQNKNILIYQSIILTYLEYINIYLSLGHFANDFIIFKNTNIKILWSYDQFILIIRVEIEQLDWADIITSNCPQNLFSGFI